MEHAGEATEQLLEYLQDKSNMFLDFPAFRQLTSSSATVSSGSSRAKVPHWRQLQSIQLAADSRAGTAQLAGRSSVQCSPSIWCISLATVVD